MHKSHVATIVFFVLSAVSCFCAVGITSNSNIAFVFLFPTVIFSILFVGFLSVAAAKRINEKISPYKVFAIAESGYSVCLITYAIYNMTADAGFFNAVFRGFYLLITVIPTAIIILSVNFKLWKR